MFSLSKDCTCAPVAVRARWEVRGSTTHPSASAALLTHTFNFDNAIPAEPLLRLGRKRFGPWGSKFNKLVLTLISSKSWSDKTIPVYDKIVV